MKKSLRSLARGLLYRAKGLFVDAARSVRSAACRRGLGKLVPQADVCILDPWCDGPGGHHESWNSALVANVKQRGLSAAVLTSDLLPHSFVQQGPYVPFFKSRPYQHVATGSELLHEVSRATTAMTAGLAALKRMRSNNMPALLMHTPLLHHLFALTDFYEQPGGDAPKIALLMHLPPDMAVAPSVAPLARALFTVGLKQLLAAGAGKVSVFAASRPVAEYLADIGGPLLPVAHPPIAVPSVLPPLPPDIAAALRGTDSLPVLVWVGDGRRERGLHLLLEAMAKMRGAEPVVRCVVLVRQSLADLGLSAPACGNLLTVFERVHLPYRQVLAVFAASDCIVLPYDPDRYQNRLSNVVFEAAGVGTPFISMGGSCSIRAESEALGVTSAVWMEAPTADGLVKAIGEFARQAPALRQCAHVQAASYRDMFRGDALLDAALDS